MKRFIVIRLESGGMKSSFPDPEDPQASKYLNVYDRPPTGDDIFVQSTKINDDGAHGDVDSAPVQAGVVSDTKDPQAAWSSQAEWEYFFKILQFHSARPGGQRPTPPVNPYLSRPQPTGPSGG